MENVFFSNWNSLFRICVVGICAYIGLIVLLRVSGKRTLTKMNAFDFVVTVALGSTLATVLLSKDVALADGLVAFALLIFLQLTITWLSVRWARFSKLIKAEPTLLVFRGTFLKDALKAERVTEDEILSILRANGVSDTDQADAVIMETDGSLSILKKVENIHSKSSALSNVKKVSV
jgi:uncharacterized membrane protein YcaP (DUF421 family)